MPRTENQRIHQQLILPVEALAHIKDRLVLIGLPPGKEVASVTLDRAAHGFDFEQGLDLLTKRFAAWNRGQNGIRIGVLRIDPDPGLSAVLVFEPAVGIGDLRALDGLGYGGYRSGGGRRCLRLTGRLRAYRESMQEEKKNRCDRTRLPL